MVRQRPGRADRQWRVQEPGAQALGHRPGQRAALSFELPVLSALRGALPPARPSRRVRGRPAAADDHPQCRELCAQPRHHLPADPQPHGYPAGGAAGGMVPPRLELRDVPRHHQRGHHAELHGAAGGHGAGCRLAGAADAGARGRGVRPVLARLADGMAADVPHPARHAGGALGVRVQLAAAVRLDRPVPRRHGSDGRDRRLGLAGPRGRGRNVRPHLDRQGGALGVGRLHLGQGRLHVGRHGRLPAGRRRGLDPRHPGLGHLALGRHDLDAGRGLLRAALPVAPLGRPALARPVGDLRRHLRGRRDLQPLRPAAGPADADQRHGLADGRLGGGAGRGAREPPLRRPPAGGAVGG